jgi:prepilin peptidase CpaA
MVVQTLLTMVLLLFCLGVIYGAISDVTSYTIPNWVPYGLAGLFAVFAALTWGSLPLFLHVALGLFVFALCIVFWKFGWLGGGDVKFVGAIALWMGPRYILAFVLLLALLSAGFVMLLRFARQWNPYFQGGQWPGFIKQMVQKAEENACPYGLPAAVSALIVAPGLFADVY